MNRHRSGLWAGGAGVYFAVDCGITVRAKRILPETLVSNVTDAMAEGDVLKALQNCENEPGALANVLTAGFSHVEEGFDVIQEAIAPPIMARSASCEKSLRREGAIAESPQIWIASDGKLANPHSAYALMCAERSEMVGISARMVSASDLYPTNSVATSFSPRNAPTT